MTSDKLKQRLQESVNVLRSIVNSLDSLPSTSLHPSCVDEIRKFDMMANTLHSICDRIEIREYARQLLNNLLDTTDSTTNIVDYHGTRMPFSTARMLGFITYLSMTWTICDSITTVVAPLVCTESYKDKINPPQLLTYFIRDNKKENKLSSYYSAYFLQVNYGWAIGVSYVIRNHFVHDGALLNGDDFFEGTSLRDGFKISTKGWNLIEADMANKHNKLSKDQNRLGLTDQWPWHQDNLLKLLELCNNEIDDALSCLVGWSVGMAKLQASYLLERDL